MTEEWLQSCAMQSCAMSTRRLLRLHTASSTFRPLRTKTGDPLSLSYTVREEDVSSDGVSTTSVRIRFLADSSDICAYRDAATMYNNDVEALVSVGGTCMPLTVGRGCAGVKSRWNIVPGTALQGLGLTSRLVNVRCGRSSCARQEMRSERMAPAKSFRRQVHQQAPIATKHGIRVESYPCVNP